MQYTAWLLCWNLWTCTSCTLQVQEYVYLYACICDQSVSIFIMLCTVIHSSWCHNNRLVINPNPSPHSSWCFLNSCRSPLWNCLPHFGQTWLRSYRILSYDVGWFTLAASSLRWLSGMAWWYCCCGWWGCTGRDGAGVGETSFFFSSYFRRLERICKK